MDRAAWPATVNGVAKSQRGLSEPGSLPSGSAGKESAYDAGD